MPAHVAIIMDGNGRWAESRGLSRLNGHRKGAEVVREVVRACPDLGLTHLTLFAFSTENWKRPVREVLGLMALFRRYIRAEADELATKGVQVRFIGERSRLHPSLQKLMAGLEARTAGNDQLVLTIAINYGGRDELTRAARALAQRVASGALAADAVTADVFADALDTTGLPDPDLVIRTSGEMRISNFLLWQAAYSEYAFVDVQWPDFSVPEFARVLHEFTKRERRFGAVTA
ncbi:polyprenyl diphosphate synthase [Paroceanicella profunda]|nr:polyprenyl diphosphate synthase [Paroceanicella profunda]